MRTIAALLVAVPLFATAQTAAPPQTWTTDPPPAAAPPPAAQPAPAPAAQPAPAQPAYPPPPQAAPPAPPPPQYAPPPQYPPRSGPAPQYAPPMRRAQTRDSWYIGFGFGGGDGKLATERATFDFKNLHPSDPTNVFFDFKVGATMSPRLLLGLDLGVMTSAASSGGITTSLGVANVDAMLTYFPWERGFFVKGGFGRSAVTYGVEDAFGTANGSASGWNVAGGVGYSWWLGQQFNLTATLDFSRQWLGSADFTFVDPVTGASLGAPTDSQFWALWLGFDWY